MTITPLLLHLEHQIDRLFHQVMPCADHEARAARFDKQLFTTSSRRLGDCFSEIEGNVTWLKQLARDGRQEQCHWIANRIVDQIAALQRECRTLALREREEQAQPPADPAFCDKLTQYQDYERRLEAMRDARESQLANATSAAQRQRLQRELAALEGRLMRCRQAIATVKRAADR